MLSGQPDSHKNDRAAGSIVFPLCRVHSELSTCQSGQGCLACAESARANLHYALAYLGIKQHHFQHDFDATADFQFMKSAGKGRKTTGANSIQMRRNFTHIVSPEILLPFSPSRIHSNHVRAGSCNSLRAFVGEEPTRSMPSILQPPCYKGINSNRSLEERCDVAISRGGRGWFGNSI